MRSGILAAAFAILVPIPVFADNTWDDLRAEIFGDAVPVVSADVVGLDVPYRTYEDPRTEIGATITAPFGEFIKSVQLIIDDNPMPVAAVFDLAEPQRVFSFSGTMRINGPSMVRVVATMNDGKLYMQESFVKTSGVGACAAPPGTDPVEALATLGTMNFLLLPDQADGKSILASLKSTSDAEPATADTRTAQLDIDHPSHSGMQMDQITLLFIPMRYVETVHVKADDKALFTLTGSISLSENPAIKFEIPQDSVGVGVKMTDTEGATFEETFTLQGG
ncbi:MAG: thiosulfate oxidation carrier protein SoxY [Pseudomonadota bacterium]